MSLTNIKLKSQAERGFTIVELLIVVVVIAILAAITIVSYNGITARANQSAAKASAATVQKKAELYNSDSGNNRYPIVGTELTSAAASTSYFVSGITVNYSTTALTSSAGNNTVRVLKCSTTAPTTNTQANITSPATPPSTQAISGLKIFYWDPVANAESSAVNVGDTTNCPTS